MASLWTQMTTREASPAVQFIKYALCGTAATAANAVFFFLLSWLVIPALGPDDLAVRVLGLAPAAIPDALRAQHAMVNNVLAFLPSNLVAYLLNILWVFRAGRRYPLVDRALAGLGLAARPGDCGGAHRVVEIALFYAVSAIAIAAGTVLMGMLIRLFGMTTTAAFGAQAVASVLINYVVRKHVIFQG